MLIESTSSWRPKERSSSIVAADRLARALGTTSAKMFPVQVQIHLLVPLTPAVFHRGFIGMGCDGA